MSRYCVVVSIVLFLVLSAVDSASLDLKVNEAVRIDSVFKIVGTKKLETRVNGSQDSVSKSGGVRIDSIFKIDPKVFGTKKLESVKGARVNGSQDNVSKSERNEELGSKDGSSVQNSGKEVIPEAKGKDLSGNVDAKKEKASGNVDIKGLGNEGGRTGAKDGFKGDVVLSKEKSGVETKEDRAGEATVTKDGFRREECDQSTMCEDNDKKFVACLQVPGNESPDIFLLIKNKGKGPRTITISAPTFVHLEKNEVQVLEKEDQKVKVSIGGGGTSHVIVLKEGNSQCSLDYKDLIAHNSGQDTAEISAKPYTNFASSTRSIVIVFLSVFVVMLVSVWACFTIRNKQFLRRSKYQRMDNEVLPISTPVKADSGGNDGWDDSWGDSWDDEEAPHTPSLPLTPSLSSKGLASRRLSKEGWKD